MTFLKILIKYFFYVIITIGDNMKIITICGSLKFEEEIKKVSFDMELRGNCVLSIIYPVGDKNSVTEEQLNVLGIMHKEKIKMSDAILVVDVDNYIGSSTKEEIKYAQSLGKEVMYYSDIYKEN